MNNPYFTISDNGGKKAIGELSCEARSLDVIRGAERLIAERGRPEPFGPVLDGFEPLPEAERRERAAAFLR